MLEETIAIVPGARPFSDPEHVDGRPSVYRLQRGAFILLQTIGVSPVTSKVYTVS